MRENESSKVNSLTFEMKTIAKSPEIITKNQHQRHQSTKVVEIRMENEMVAKEEENRDILKGSSNSAINISEKVLVHSKSKPPEQISANDYSYMIDVGEQYLQQKKQEFVSPQKVDDVEDKTLKIKPDSSNIVSTNDLQNQREQQSDIENHNDRRLSVITTDNEEDFNENEVDEESKSVKSANTAITDISNSNLSTIVATTTKTTSAENEKEESSNTTRNERGSIITSPVNTTPVTSTTPTKFTYTSQRTLDCSTPSNESCQEEHTKNPVEKDNPHHGESINSFSTPSKDSYKQPDKTDKNSILSGTDQISNSGTTLSERGDSSTSLISRKSASTMSGGGGRRDDYNIKETRPSSRVSNMSYSSQIGMNEVCSSFFSCTIIWNQIFSLN